MKNRKEKVMELISTRKNDDVFLFKKGDEVFTIDEIRKRYNLKENDSFLYLLADGYSFCSKNSDGRISEIFGFEQTDKQTEI